MRHEYSAFPWMSPARVTLKIAKDGVALNYQEDAAEFDGIVGHLKNSMAPFIRKLNLPYNPKRCDLTETLQFTD